MRTAVFDIETNGFYHLTSKVHSLVIHIVETGQTFSCADQPNYLPITEGLKILNEADVVVGHNIIKFDIPVLQKLYPNLVNIPLSKVRDTLIYSRLLKGDLTGADARLVRLKKLPSKMMNSHGLEAWGYRLGLNKGDYAKEMAAKGLDPWAFWNKPMQDYCELDVQVTLKLWHELNQGELPERAIELEHKFCHIIGLQERFGFPFDKEAAVRLYLDLNARRKVIDEQLSLYFKPWYVNKGLCIPKVSNKTKGVTKGVAYTKVELTEFNPASRDHIANRLTRLYGWKPTEVTETGKPRVDETTLKTLNHPVAELLIERFLIEKRIGQVAEGQQAWLKLERNGRIHGSVNTLGAVTGRCTHAAPNVAQVPSVKALYGERCRALFGPDKGFVQVGADASGLELRCLGHYMAAYDGGAYALLLLEGDVHTVNQLAAGLPTRDNAKTFIYAFLYGAGDEKIGEIVGKGAAVGKKLKENFLKKTPALKRLREAVEAKATTAKTLRGIDGRTLQIRHAHAALNTLLQSAGALLVKQATINLYEELERRGYTFGTHWAMLAHIHDEYQLQVLPELVDEVKQVAVWSFQEAGRQFNWRCALDGEAKHGANWAETH